jgi:hypothetical protein
MFLNITEAHTATEKGKYDSNDTATLWNHKCFIVKKNYSVLAETMSQSGIKIKCKKLFEQFLLTQKPNIVINDGTPEQLDWNKEFFIELQPMVPYKITIQFPYMNAMRGAASIAVQVSPNETQSYEYHTPGLMTQPGTISRKS